MKKPRFSEQQIAFILKQAEDETTVEEVCRKAGISIQTYYRWRSKYGGLMPSEMKRLKQLEEENGRLKRLVANLSLDKEMLQDVIKRKMYGLIGPASWLAICRPATVSPNGGTAMCSLPTGQPSGTSPAVPIRPVSKCGSRSLPRRVCAMATGVSTSCCGGKDGKSTTRRPDGSTANSACSCATRRPSAR